MSQSRKFDTEYPKISYSIASIDFQNIYTIVEKASNFEKDIDRRIIQFEKQGINISTCPEYFENMIDEHIARLLNKLETAHARNMHFIGRLFRKRISAKVELEDFLARLEIEIADTDAEFKALKKFAEEMNPLKDGRLVSEETITSPKKEVPNE